MERIEKLEERLLKQKRRLQQSEAYLREQRRKADVKRKINLGALFDEAGLEKFERDVLRGGLLLLRENLQDPPFLQACKNKAEKRDAEAAENGGGFDSVEAVGEIFKM